MHVSAWLTEIAGESVTILLVWVCVLCVCFLVCLVVWVCRSARARARVCVCVCQTDMFAENTKTQATAVLHFQHTHIMDKHMYVP